MSEDTNKAILFGLKLKREEIVERLKKAEKRFEGATFGRKETEADCKRIDLTQKLEEIDEDIEKYSQNTGKVTK